MKKAGSDMRSEYDFSAAVRGKHAARYAEGTNVVVLAPDLAELFPDSAAVNDALRLLVRAGRESTKSQSSSRRHRPAHRRPVTSPKRTR